jgi:hypothetical protein
MTEQNPTSPPTEMLQQWMDLPLSEEERLAIAYCAGADAELKKCVSFLYEKYYFTFRAVGAWGMPVRVDDDLFAVRRPNSQ